MKKNIYFLVITSSLFILNILLYIYSDDYSFFFKKLKYGDEAVYLDNSKISDDYSLSLYNKNQDLITKNNSLNKEEELKKEQDCICDKKEVIINNCENTNTGNVLLDKNINTFDENKKTNIGNDIQGKDIFILGLFNKYNLYKLLDSNHILFGIKEINPYIEYIGGDLKIIFIDDSYDSLKQILSVDDNFFEINEANNFGDRSFYINLKDDDSYVRIIIEYKNQVFGLQIKKHLYNEIKQILVNNL